MSKQLVTHFGGGVHAFHSSAFIYPNDCHCDHGTCGAPVTAVVMVTSGSTVEVRTACESHIDRVHQGWANKQVAIVRVNT